MSRYEAIGQHSSSAELAIARDTIDFFASWTQSNGFCTVYPSCIHAGMVDCIPKLCACSLSFSLSLSLSLFLYLSL